MFVKERLKNITNFSGIYQMLDKNKKIIYIGKAKNLKKRISQYFYKSWVDKKTMALVANIKDFELIVTNTETQALLLENELIKQHKPKYNILLKDAKSYPYICITDDKYPRVGFYRGNKKENYNFFGPYSSANVVRNSLTLLKKIFKVRQCSNSFYRSRSRPCLEYQIKLCSAPCVAKITYEDYQQDVRVMAFFLAGKGAEILSLVSKKMQQASKNLDFEAAVRYRDQLISLRTIQEQHTSQSTYDMDVIGICQEEGIYGIELLCIRQGKQISQEFILPQNSKLSIEAEVLQAFLPLYYLGKVVPKQILISSDISDKKIIAKALSTNIITKVNKDKKHFLNIANLTVKENLKRHIQFTFSKKTQLMKLQKILALKTLPKTIECFDISHTSGTATTASCVVFEKGLAKKSKYRQFNIKNIVAGDDCAAINQAVYRRYARFKKEGIAMPEIIFIDGGLGQLNQAIIALDSIGVSTKVVGIAKAKSRQAGLETLIVKNFDDVEKISLTPNNSTLLFINLIRDEAHRFAIKNHRKKRSKKQLLSVLDGINGVGKLRRIALLHYFGSIEDIKKASVDEIKKVVGINQQLAVKINNILQK